VEDQNNSTSTEAVVVEEEIDDPYPPIELEYLEIFTSGEV